MLGPDGIPQGLADVVLVFCNVTRPACRPPVFPFPLEGGEVSYAFF